MEAKLRRAEAGRGQRGWRTWLRRLGWLGAAAARPVLFPRGRLVALVFLLVWTPSYALVWGWRNFLQLCDVTVFLTVLGIWRGSALLLSSQTIVSFIINMLWGLDVAARLLTGGHVIGGTEYMWNPQYPLAVRLLSLFHLALPPVHLLCLRRTGYDPRALAFATGLTAVVFLVSRFLAEPGANPNFLYVAPIFNRPLGPAPLHMAIIFGVQVVVLMLPVHVVLRRLLPAPR